MKRNFVKIGVGSLLAVAVFSTTAFTETYSRSINAWFSNIKVQVDGKEVLLDEELFVFNDMLYLPASVITDGLGLEYEYPIKENIVNIETFGRLGYDSETSLVPIVQQKNNELQNLSRKLTELEKEIHAIKQGKFPYRRIGTVAEMQTYLRDHFKNLGDITMSITLTQLSTGKYRIVASPTNNSSQLSSLDRRDIEGWVEDMFYAIRELYDARATVEGYIRSTGYSTNHVTYYTSSNRLYFNFAQLQNKTSSQVDGVKLEEKLNRGNLKRYNNVSFTYEVFVNRYDVDLMVYFDQSQFYSWSPTNRINYLKALKQEIESFNAYINVSGKVIDKSKAKDNVAFNFGFVDGEIISLDLSKDIEEYLNKNYKLLYYNSKIFNFKYYVAEMGDGQLIINVEGDFSKQGTDWTSVEGTIEHSLRSHIQNAFRYADGILNRDISGEIVDKNQEFIGSLRYYKPSEYSIRVLESIIIQ